MKSKTNLFVMLALLTIAPWFTNAQEIIGYSGLFIFDTRITDVSGQVTDQSNGNAVQGATVVITGPSNSYTSTSQSDGSYSIEGIPTGNYLMSVIMSGFLAHNQSVFIAGEPTQTINVQLVPGGDSQLEISGTLIAYAENITEGPPNVFTLSGNTNINNLLFFGGELKIDKRPSLNNIEISGIGSIFVPNIGGITKYISNGGIPFKFYEEDNKFYAVAQSYFFELPVLLGGFPLTLAGIEFDASEVRLRALPKIPYPIDAVINHYLDDEIPTIINNVSGTIIYSQLNGEDFEVNINNLEANLELVAVKDLNLYYYSSGSVFGGNLLLKIPGRKATIGRGIEEDEPLHVKVYDEEGNFVNEVEFEEFVETMRFLGSDAIEIYMEIEFVSGALNNLAVTLSGVHIPLFTTGLNITEIHGGVYNLATKDWHVEATVGIETGLSKIPGTDKAPLKLDNFGVMIQPMDVFRGMGAFQVFESNVADGFVEYNRSKSSVTMEGNFNLAGILDGGLYANLQYRKFTGNGHFTVMTPCDLPWYLNWIECEIIGSAYAEVNNQSFQSEVDLRWISFAQKLEFGNPDFPYFHYYLGRNLKKLHQIWKGTRDGKQSISFQVSENTGQILVVSADTINPTLFDITLQSPTGQLFDMNNANHYQHDSLNKQTIMSILQPIEGEWYVLTAYEGDLAVYVIGVDQKPSVLVDQPSSRRTRSNEISLTFNDYADTVQVQVYYNTNNKRFDGSFIDEFTLINNAVLNFTWANQDVPNGEYFIYSRIDDGKNTPVLQYAPGSIWVENDPNIETPQNFIAIQEADSVNANWSAPQQPYTFASVVYYKDLSTGRTEQKAVVGNNSTTLKNLLPGRGYEIWCKFINEEGTYSPKSNTETLVFASSNRNNPPYFTMDRDSIFVFIAGEYSQYNLLANDADGDLLTFSIPGNDLGLTITDSQFSWLPDTEQRGVYKVQFVVSDGSETDTTSLQFVVYTPDQLKTRIGFNSVRLYEADNTFIILRNFFSEQPTQNVTLTNIRTMEQAVIECRRVNKFEYMGQFFLSYQNRSEITVANGDSIRATYNFDDESYLAYAYYDTLAQPTDVTPPGIISDLTAERLENNRVKLKWTATGNDDDIGKAYRYDIRYAYEPIDDEGAYFTAYLIQNFPYPSISGQKDSLIINLLSLEQISQHEMIYFTVKAEDEAQNRSALGNSAEANCILDPFNLQASVQNTYIVELNWEDLNEDLRKNRSFQYFRLFRKFNNGSFSLLQDMIEADFFNDNLRNLPDGVYQYGLQAVYAVGQSDTITTQDINLDRFMNVNILVELGTLLNDGVTVEMTGIDTIYAQEYTKITNPTGLILLQNVFKSNYQILLDKDGFVPIVDTITVTNANHVFNYQLECIPSTPVDLAVVEATGSSFTLQWTQTGTESHWDIIYGQTGFDIETEGIVIENLSSLPFTVEELAGETAYDFYIRAVCGENHSDWSDPLTASTSQPEGLTLNFGQGYTWFSVNVNPGSMGLNDLFTELEPCYDDRIIGQTSFALYTGSMWAGTLSQLALDRMFRMRLCSQQSITLSGEPAPIEPIALNAGYTWLGYVPQACMPINQALVNMNPAPSYDDRMIGQNAFALYSGTQWVGTLGNLCPGAGYIIRLANQSELTYAQATASQWQPHNEEHKAVISPTGINPNIFRQHTMMMVAKLELGPDYFSNNPNDVVYAYINGEVHGIAVPMPENDGAIFMNIGADAEDAVEVSFKVWLDAEQRLVNIQEKLTFSPLAAAGHLNEPMILRLGQSAGEYFIGEAFPNPFYNQTIIPYSLPEAATLQLKLYNSMGQLVRLVDESREQAGSYQLMIKQSDLKKGVYHAVISISTPKKAVQQTIKLILQ